MNCCPHDSFSALEEYLKAPPPEVIEMLDVEEPQVVEVGEAGVEVGAEDDEDVVSLSDETVDGTGIALYDSSADEDDEDEERPASIAAALGQILMDNLSSSAKRRREEDSQAQLDHNI